MPGEAAPQQGQPGSRAAQGHTSVPHPPTHRESLPGLVRPPPQVVVAHNGPAGLGARRHSICGIDWTEPPADFGDPDLQVGGWVAAWWRGASLVPVCCWYCGSW